MSQWVNEWIKEWRSFGTNSHMKEWQNVAGMPCQSQTHPLVTANWGYWRPAASHVLIGSLSHWTCPEVSILMSDECINTKILFVSICIHAGNFLHAYTQSPKYSCSIYMCSREKTVEHLGCKQSRDWVLLPIFSIRASFRRRIKRTMRISARNRNLQSQVTSCHKVWTIWNLKDVPSCIQSSGVTSHAHHMVSHRVTRCHVVSHGVTWCHVL